MMPQQFALRGIAFRQAHHDCVAFAGRTAEPLAQFVHDSIATPDKYIQSGYPKGVMPKSYGSLPPADLTALVDFLTKPQG